MLQDPRFAELFQSAEYALDPTDPRFKKMQVGHHLVLRMNGGGALGLCGRWAFTCFNLRRRLSVGDGHVTADGAPKLAFPGLTCACTSYGQVSGLIWECRVFTTARCWQVCCRIRLPLLLKSTTSGQMGAVCLTRHIALFRLQSRDKVMTETQKRRSQQADAGPASKAQGAAKATANGQAGEAGAGAGEGSAAGGSELRAMVAKLKRKAEQEQEKQRAQALGTGAKKARL